MSRDIDQEVKLLIDLAYNAYANFNDSRVHVFLDRLKITLRDVKEEVIHGAEFSLNEVFENISSGDLNFGQIKYIINRLKIYNDDFSRDMTLVGQ